MLTGSPSAKPFNRMSNVILGHLEEPGRLRDAAHNLGEPMAVRPRVWCCRILPKTGRNARYARECPLFQKTKTAP
jgi:hypothetical protein